jgi:hypothetical protein
MTAPRPGISLWSDCRPFGRIRVGDRTSEHQKPAQGPTLGKRLNGPGTGGQGHTRYSDKARALNLPMTVG